MRYVDKHLPQLPWLQGSEGTQSNWCNQEWQRLPYIYLLNIWYGRPTELIVKVQIFTFLTGGTAQAFLVTWQEKYK